MSDAKRTLTVRQITDEEVGEPADGGRGMPWLLADADASDQVVHPMGMLGLVPDGHFRYRLAVEELRRYYVPRGYGEKLAEYHYLCLACGESAPYEAWGHLIRDWETEELRPAREGDSDPIDVCPHCDWHHTDDDGNPGIADGSFDDVEAERVQALDDWKEHWEDEITWVDMLALQRIGDEQWLQMEIADQLGMDHRAYRREVLGR